MAWDDDMPLMLRGLLNDTSATPVYQDDTLIQMILLQAMVLGVRNRFAADYAIDYAGERITPDPTLKASYDRPFVLLTVYASTVQIIAAEVRDMTRQGIDVQDGDSRISLKRDVGGLKLMLDAYRKAFDDLLFAYQTNGGDGFGEAIVTPYPIFSSFGAGPGGWSPALRDRAWGR